MYSVVGQDLHLKMVPYRQIISIALFIYCNSIYRDSDFILCKLHWWRNG